MASQLNRCGPQAKLDSSARTIFFKMWDMSEKICNTLEGCRSTESFLDPVGRRPGHDVESVLRGRGTFVDFQVFGRNGGGQAEPDTWTATLALAQAALRALVGDCWIAETSNRWDMLSCS